MKSTNQKTDPLRRVFAVLASVCSWAFVHAESAENAGPPPVPHEQAAYRAVAFHNEYVTVLWMDIPGKHESDYHVHSRDMTCVVVADYPPEAYTQPLGGQPGKPRQPERGNVSFVAYYGKPSMTHRDVNPGTLAAHQICAEFNSPQPSGFTVASRDVPGYVQVLENERLRAWRLILEPGQSAPVIKQNAPGLRVVISGGEITEIVPGKNDRGIVLRPDHFYWQDAGATRAVRNSGTTRIELVEYEFK
jgi:hypothetical protein